MSDAGTAVIIALGVGIIVLLVGYQWQTVAPSIMPESASIPVANATDNNITYNGSNIVVVTIQFANDWQTVDNYVAQGYEIKAMSTSSSYSYSLQVVLEK